MFHLMKIITLTILIITTLCVTPTIIIPKHAVSLQQQQQTYTYYEIQISSSTQELLLITVDTQLQVYIQIYTSYDFLYPSEQNFTLQCQYRSLDSCAIRIDKNQSMIYFSVYVSTTTNLTIQADFGDTYPITINKYRANFSTFQSIILSLQASTFSVDDQTIVITAFYNSYKNIGKFNILAALDDLPMSWNNRIYSDSVGSLRRTIKLQKPLNQNSTYYILIEGEQNVVINVSVQIYTNELTLNKPYYDIIYQNQNYSLSNSIDQNITQKLILRLVTYEGYGTFIINYCDIQTFNYTNVDGIQVDIQISLQNRLACLNHLQTTQSLSIQNIEISVVDSFWRIAFSCGIYEDDVQNMIISVGQQLYGKLTQNDKEKVYILDSIESSNISIFISTINGSLSYSLTNCQLNKKKKLINSTCQSIDLEERQYNFISIKKKFAYFIYITQKSNSTEMNSQYLIEIQSFPKEHIPITPQKPIESIISMNQYHYYFLDTSNLGPTNSTEISIQLIGINGQVLLFTSRMEQQPSFMTQNNNSQVKFAWSGQIKYYLNSNLSTIYIGILGDTQAIYHLQVIVNTDADIPIKYQTIIQYTGNDFTLTSNQNYAYFKYSSHEIPYKIVLSPQPQCIYYGSSLPINTTACMTLPKKFTNKILFFKVVQENIKNQSSYRFSVKVITPYLILTPNSPVFIACQSDCYQLIHLEFQNSLTIIKTGEGNLSLANSSQLFETQTIKLNCTGSCSYILNASLFYGTMKIQYEQSAGAEIQWWSKSFTWDKNPKHLYMKLSEYSKLDSFLIYNGGLTPEIYLNIFTMSDNFTNTINYFYPTRDFYSHKHETTPTRRMQFVQIPQQIVQLLNCTKINNRCFITVSIYINTTVEYDLNYLLNGVGYFSKNNYKYYLPYNQPLQMFQARTLNFFYSYVKNLETFRVNMQPLSNCRPYIMQSARRGNYDVYYTDIGLIQNQTINFEIFSNEQCVYYVILSQILYKTVVQNVPYYLDLNDFGDSTLVVYNHQSNNINFTIFLNTNLTILINKINDTNNYTLPTLKNYNFIKENTNQFSIESNQTAGLYLINITSVDINNFRAKQFKIMVYNKQLPIHLLHNQQQTYTFPQGNISQRKWVYHSSSSWLLYLQIEEDQQVHVTITTGNQDIIVSKYMNQVDDPYIQIKNLRPVMITYFIIIQAQNSTIKMHTQQQGINGLIQLYQGIMLLDAFNNYGNTNCYIYNTYQLVGHQQIIIDLTFKVPISEKEIKYYINIENGLIKSNIIQISPYSLRITFPYSINMNYKICYSLRNLMLIGQQYYLLVNVPTMTHIVPQYLYQGQNNLYEMFEIINSKSIQADLFIEMTNCIGRTDMFASYSYSKMSQGRYSHISDEWSNGDSYIGIAAVNPGYYYLGAKSQSSSVYTFQTQYLVSKQFYNDNWQLSSRMILNIFQRQDKLIIELPPVVNKLKKYNYTVKNVTYALIIDNNTNNNVNFQAIVKCPTLFPTPYGVFYEYTEVWQQVPQFSVNISTLPNKFNLSARAHITIMNNYGEKIVLTYFYLQDVVTLSCLNGWIIFVIVLAVLIGISGLVSIIVIIIWRKWKARTMSRVNFEMAEYQTNDIPTNRKPINDKVAYGQFVDQTQ